MNSPTADSSSLRRKLVITIATLSFCLLGGGAYFIVVFGELIPPVLQENQLIVNGAETNGIIIKLTDQAGKYSVIYEYIVGDQRFSKNEDVDVEVFSALTEGGSISVAYDPHNPENATSVLNLDRDNYGNNRLFLVTALGTQVTLFILLPAFYLFRTWFPPKPPNYAFYNRMHDRFL
jgi:hypothetical protein